MREKSRFIQLHECNFLRNYMGKMRLKKNYKYLMLHVFMRLLFGTLGQYDFSPIVLPPVLLRLFIEKAKGLSS